MLPLSHPQSHSTETLFWHSMLSGFDQDSISSTPPGSESRIMVSPWERQVISLAPASFLRSFISGRHGPEDWCSLSPLWPSSWRGSLFQMPMPCSLVGWRLHAGKSKPSRPGLPTFLTHMPGQQRCHSGSSRLLSQSPTNFSGTEILSGRRRRPKYEALCRSA